MSVATLVQSAPPAAGLHVLISAEGATTVVAVRGEADISTLSVVVDALARVIADQEGDVVVDLAQTDFIDTATLRAMLRAREVLLDGERQLTLRSPSSIAGRLLALFGLSHLVEPAPRTETGSPFGPTPGRMGEEDESPRDSAGRVPPRRRRRVRPAGGEGSAMTMDGRA